jgi:hypothetical protein
MHGLHTHLAVEIEHGHDVVLPPVH